MVTSASSPPAVGPLLPMMSPTHPCAHVPMWFHSWHLARDLPAGPIPYLSHYLYWDSPLTPHRARHHVVFFPVCPYPSRDRWAVPTIRGRSRRCVPPTPHLSQTMTPSCMVRRRGRAPLMACPPLPSPSPRPRLPRAWLGAAGRPWAALLQPRRKSDGAGRCGKGSRG